MPKSPGITIKNTDHDITNSKQTWERDGIGLNPDYVNGFEGSRMFSNSILYGKNLSLFHKLCEKCDKFTGKTDTVGKHCGLPVNERCQE